MKPGRWCPKVKKASRKRERFSDPQADRSGKKAAMQMNGAPMKSALSQIGDKIHADPGDVLRDIAEAADLETVLAGMGRKTQRSREQP